jgi:hypothetical protein
VTDPTGTASAVHIGADMLADPRRAHWARLRSCRGTVERLTRVCHAAGVGSQHALLGADASVDRVREVVAESAGRTGPGGLFVLTFSGHSERPVPGGHGGGWCLRDGVLQHTETAALLAAAPPAAHLVVVADTCHAAAFSRALAAVPAATVLLAACAENQATLDYPVSMFVAELERLTFPGGTANPECVSYAWLRRELRRDTPDVERPDVRANRAGALRRRPFRIAREPRPA